MGNQIVVDKIPQDWLHQKHSKFYKSLLRKSASLGKEQAKNDEREERKKQTLIEADFCTRTLSIIQHTKVRIIRLGHKEVRSEQRQRKESPPSPTTTDGHMTSLHLEFLSSC